MIDKPLYEGELKRAHDEVLAALVQDDPTTALRAAAIEIAGRGLGKKGAQAVFTTVCEELAEKGREEEASLVAYVLDMMSEW